MSEAPTRAAANIVALATTDDTLTEWVTQNKITSKDKTILFAGVIASLEAAAKAEPEEPLSPSDLVDFDKKRRGCANLATSYKTFCRARGMSIKGSDPFTPPLAATAPREKIYQIVPPQRPVEPRVPTWRASVKKPPVDIDSSFVESLLSVYSQEFNGLDITSPDIYPFLRLEKLPSGRLVLFMGTLTEVYPKDGPISSLRGHDTDLMGQVDFEIVGRRHPNIAKMANGQAAFISCSQQGWQRNMRGILVEEGSCVRMWVHDRELNQDHSEMHVYAQVQDGELVDIDRNEYNRAKKAPRSGEGGSGSGRYD